MLDRWSDGDFLVLLTFTLNVNARTTLEDFDIFPGSQYLLLRPPMYVRGQIIDWIWPNAEGKVLDEDVQLRLGVCPEPEVLHHVLGGSEQSYILTT